ncbi:hypothetical protein E0493_04075 [Roseomonas sp. M0104]|uniref:Tetratricopeptide repeat protein n=1 Tax=Teichococcus coralli TaxID=2545983 RepID=A0A845B8F8_9PROT|nr:hypothetical protein [Pseudoroseomonas coralli]MXP62530.1 hypothetical protein [Pseudoroseomonas coralli]
MPSPSPGRGAAARLGAMPLCHLCLLVAFLAAAPAGAAELRVLSPGPEDCEDLAQRLALLPRGRQEPARSLGEEGVQLCQEGQVRQGVSKLRRALRTAQHNPRPVPAD